MNHLQRRTERAETALVVAESEIVAEIVRISDGPLPPEERTAISSFDTSPTRGDAGLRIPHTRQTKLNGTERFGRESCQTSN